MRLPDDNKRRQILSTAAEMFATEPYHKVRLDDVAAKAGVGKGTLYVYFQSKEDLYFTIVYDALAKILSRLRTQLAGDHTCALHRLKTIVGELVEFAFQNPPFFELVKTLGVPKGNANWDAERNDMFNIIEQTIRDGVAAGELRDPNPTLTARFIPGMVRSAMLYGSNDLDPQALKQQICDLLEHGLAAKIPAQT
jgi:AcrR family transcriptional regulator